MNASQEQELKAFLSQISEIAPPWMEILRFEYQGFGETKIEQREVHGMTVLQTIVETVPVCKVSEKGNAVMVQRSRGK